jgi:hypothetical protein
MTSEVKMLQFTRKFQFDAALLDTILPDTLGATFLDKDERFEVATDQDYSQLGTEVSISQKLAFRVTARTLDGLLYWVGRLISEVGGGKARVTAQVGYWHPTQEREASWLIETELDGLTQAQLDYLWLWLVEEDQQAAYIEYGGVVYIPDRDEVPHLLETVQVSLN